MKTLNKVKINTYLLQGIQAAPGWLRIVDFQDRDKEAVNTLINKKLVKVENDTLTITKKGEKVISKLK